MKKMIAVVIYIAGRVGGMSAPAPIT